VLPVRPCLDDPNAPVEPGSLGACSGICPENSFLMKKPQLWLVPAVLYLSTLRHAQLPGAWLEWAEVFAATEAERICQAGEICKYLPPLSREDCPFHPCITGNSRPFQYGLDGPSRCPTICVEVLTPCAHYVNICTLRYLREYEEQLRNVDKSVRVSICRQAPAGS
jgi:hypothetical protein